MELLYKTADGRYEVKFEGKTQTDLIEQLASFQEVFENSVATYNGVESTSVRWQVREVDGNKFYEQVCTDNDPKIRGARLSYGCHKKGGGVFAKRKNEDGTYNKNNGWKRFNKQTNQEE
jgi:hypothetical protein